MVKYCADAPDALHETVTMPLACVATTFCGAPGFTVIFYWQIDVKTLKTHETMGLAAL